MKTLLVAAALATLSLTAVAGQPDAKAERIAKLQKELPQNEHKAATCANALKRAQQEGNEKDVRRYQSALDMYTAKAASARMELSWLKGELTLASAEAKVKAAQEAVDKLTKDDKPHEAEDKALAAAKAELEQVKKWEADAAKDF